MKKALNLVLSATLATTLLSGCTIDKEKSSELSLKETAIIKIEKIIKEKIKPQNLYSLAFKNYDIKYPEEDILTFEDVRNIYKPENIQCKFNYTGNYLEIYDQIIDNSEKLSQIKNKQHVFIKEKNNQLGQIIKNELINYLNNLQLFETNDINEDMHSLSKTAILFDEDSNLSNDQITRFGYVSSDDFEYIIYLNKEKLIRFYEENNNQMIKKILYHELNHVRQLKCECRSQTNTIKNISYSKIPTALIEASAESKIYYNKNYSYLNNNNPNNKISVFYISERKFEEALSLLTVFRSKTMNEYYNAIFNADFNALAETYNIDEQELYKILYTYDAINLRNDFIYKYCDKYKIDVEDTSVKFIQTRIDKSCFVDIYRLYLKSIIDNNTNFSYIDCLVLKEIGKERMLNYLSNYENDTYTFFEKNVSDISNLDNIFIDYIKKYYNISDKQINTILNEKNYEKVLDTLEFYIRLDVTKEYQFRNYKTDKISESIRNIIQKYPNLIYGYYTTYNITTLQYDVFNKTKEKLKNKY